MARSLFALCSLALATAACTALLGTFEVGGERAPLDAATAGEGAVSPSGDGAASSTDATVDSAVEEPFGPLGCVELTAMRQKVGSYTKNQFALIGLERIFLATYPAANATSGVVVLRDSQGVVHALVFPLVPSGGVKDVTIPAALIGNGAQVLSAKHAGGALTLLVLQFVSTDAGTTQQAIAAYRLDDGTTLWRGPTLLTQPGELTPPGFCVLQVAASFEVRDGAAGDVIGVVSYVHGKPGSTSNACMPPYTRKVAAFGTRGGGSLALQNWNVPPDAILVDVPYDSIAIGASNVFAMVNPIGDGGTTPGSTSLLYRAGSFGTYEAQNKVPLADPQEFMIAAAFGGLGPPTAPIDTLAMVGLVGNPGTADGGSVAFVAGTVGLGAVSNFTVDSLTRTELATASELPVDRPSTRIEAFGGRAEMLMIGRAKDGRGFNAYWFDHRGRVRWRASPAVPGGVILTPQEAIARSSSADMSFISPPTLTSGELAVAWADDTVPNDPSKPVDVYASKLVCAK